jgi:hypothetical protein
MPGKINLEVQSLPTYLPGMASYPGSKGGNGTWQQIISRIPQCDLFIEAMSGSGILSEKLKSYSCSTVTNDLNRSLTANENLSYGSLIDKYDCDADRKIVFYFDPPYMLSTRRSQRKIYKLEWSDNDHDNFLSRVLTVKSDCMISHYPCEKYNNALQSWRSVRYQSMTHAGPRTECLWMNYQQPKLLLAADKVGSDCWRRQGIKRKVHRLQSKIAMLPADERAAIFTQLKKEFGI